MNILITGGAGFIGSSLAQALIARGHVVTVLDNLSEQIHGADAEQHSALYRSIKDKVRFVKGDVRHEADWQHVLPGQDAVVHLAAETGTGQSMYQLKKYTDVNIGGTALMLEWLQNNPHSVKKIVVASSRAIYGEGKYISAGRGVVYPPSRLEKDLQAGRFEVRYGDDDELLELVPTDEESKIHPISVYGITKQNQEQLVMTVCPAMGIAPVAFRYQNVYGPGQSLSNPYTGILSIFSGLIKNGKPINIFEDGKESRDFVYIDDVVKATVAGIEMEAANNQVFNVGLGVSTTVLEVAQQLLKNYGASVPVTVSGAFRLGDIRHNVADVSKLKKLLGVEPAVDFESGLKHFTDWVNEQEIGQSRYEESLAELRNKGLMK